MPLQLEIISEHRELVGYDAVHEFDERGGTIGRSLDNDWILPDPDRYISGLHATIDFKGGIYYLADVSTNGVYMNGEREPLGRGNPRRLFNGDHLRMGDFEVVVAIDRGESIAMPLEGERTELPEPIGFGVPEVSVRSGVQMLDEEELAGAPDFMSALLETETPTPVAAVKVAPAAKAKAKAEAPPAPVAMASRSSNPPAANDPAPQEVRITADDLFDTFLDGVGLSRADLDPDIDPVEVLQNAGQVLREFVSGLGRMLKSRGNLKASFRLDQTTILPRQNNPLKLADNEAESLRQLLVGRDGEYLGPRDAAREACRDLVHHQDALLDAMHAAFGEFVDRFDPEELVGAFRRDQAQKPFLGFLDRLRYWQMYRDLYPVLMAKGDSRFPLLFVEEFVRTYERQVGEYKRVDSVPNLKSTIRLEPRHAVLPLDLPATPDPVAKPAVAVVPAFADASDDQPEDAVPSIEFDDSFSALFDDDDAA